jgi:hypothetical protein
MMTSQKELFATLVSGRSVNSGASGSSAAVVSSRLIEDQTWAGLAKVCGLKQAHVDILSGLAPEPVHITGLTAAEVRAALHQEPAVIANTFLAQLKARFDVAL